MKILDRYILKSFFSPLGVTALIFCILVMLGRFFDKMSIFSDYHAKPWDIFQFLVLGLPFWLNLVLPVATMLAVLFSLGHLQLGGEITAMQSAGIPPTRLYRPYFLAGITISIFSLIGGLSFLPKLNFQSRVVYRVKIKKRDLLNYQKDNVVAAGRDNRRYTIGWLDVEQQMMRNVVVDRFDDQDRLLETIVAQEAVYRPTEPHWNFHSGVVRSYPQGDLSQAVEEPFADRAFSIPEKPEDFALVDKLPEDMTGGEMVRRMKRLRTLGAPTTHERTALHMRIALPFANMVVIAIAIPFAMRSRNQSRTQTFSYALATAFLFWGVTSMFQSLGEQGRLPAWIAAWMSTVIFGTIAVWRLLYRRING
jgi:lipopolysaccharide export system permease protein